MTGLFLALVAAAGFGEFEPSTWDVRVEVQMVSIAPRDALTLIPALRDCETAETGFMRLQKMIAHGSATLLAWPMVWTPSGTRAVCETIEEFRYPTGFNPPPYAQTVAPGKWDSFLAPVFNDSMRGTVPTAFETRNTGPTLEVEPTVGFAGKQIAILIIPRIVRHLGFSEYVDGTFPNGAVSRGLQPEFRAAQLQTYLRVPSGKPVLIASFVVPKPEPHVELFILRATAIRTTDSP